MSVMICLVLEGLWGVVNNAGVWYFAELEMTSEKVLRSVLEVNLFGAVSVTRAVLPLIRKAKGRIVNVSSLLGMYNLLIDYYSCQAQQTSRQQVNNRRTKLKH
jgi:NAD(P)-dependent dehydrogenase (short-subunit alcohol dehydrogenase family)